MATTQMPIEGVFNRETGQFIGVTDENGKEIFVPTFDSQNRLLDASGAVALDVGATASMVSRYRPAAAWASRPSTGLSAGVEFLATDVGLSPGTVMVYDGADWRPHALTQIMASSVAVPYTYSGTPVNVITRTIPGKLVNPNGGLYLETIHSVSNWTSGTVSITVLLGGVVIGNYFPVIAAANANAGYRMKLANRGVFNSQICSPNGYQHPWSGTANIAANTTAIDLSVDKQLVIQIAATNSGAAGNLESWQLFLY